MPTTVTINLSRFEAKAKDYYAELLDHSFARNQKKFETKYNPEELAREAERLLDKPHVGNPIRKRDQKGIRAVALELNEVSSKALHSGDHSRWDEFYHLVRTLMDFEETLEEGIPQTFPQLKEEFAGYEKETVEGTLKNAKAVQAQVKAAISRAPFFETKHVSIRAETGNTDEGMQASHVFSIEVGDHDANFTVFTDEHGKITEVEDVLEGGDRDFFPVGDSGGQEQADYFALVQEIRSPGSSDQGKRIVLYTARPTKDRRIYEGAHSVPSNIFLTTDADRAIGLATDLGSSEERDVWRVVMNTKYLVKTLDAGRVKDFQVVGKAPVEKIELIHEGGPSKRAAVRKAMLVRKIVGKWLARN